MLFYGVRLIFMSCTFFLLFLLCPDANLSLFDVAHERKIAINNKKKSYEKPYFFVTCSELTENESKQMPKKLFIAVRGLS